MTRLTPRTKDQAKWYQQVIQEADLADYGPVRGTIIFKPYGYAIWEEIQKRLDERIKKMGVMNVYFPMFIPYSFLKKEKEHVRGFSPELALVTYGGGKKLEEPLVVRPTSETVMYAAFAKWLQSYRDLPYKINQWVNVVRWEKRTLPFIRGLEFLWQEGHTVHASRQEAEKMVLDALMMYKEFVEEELAMYSVAGYKTEKEKFAGAVYTTSIEILLRDKKALQAGTSHMLGQNFAKSFSIKFLDEKGKLKYPWQTSWGLSTRIIGGLILALGDDRGLRLPPRIAPIQIVIIPIPKGKDRDKVLSWAKEVYYNLQEMGFRVLLDDGDHSPGYKFNHWEIKGVPLRFEVGLKETKEKQVTLVRRDDLNKKTIKVEYSLIDEILKDIQKKLFEDHYRFTLENTFEVESYSEFKKVVEKGGFVRVYYHDNPQIEMKIKEETKATARNIPLDTYEERGKDFYGQKEVGQVTLFAKAY